MRFIPNIKLNDKSTWINSDEIALNIYNAGKYRTRLLGPYIQTRKKIYLMSVIPDEDEWDYSYYIRRIEEILGEIPSNFVLSSSDCTSYDEEPEWCLENLELLERDNEILFDFYNLTLGMLAGYNADSYELTRKMLDRPQITHYVLYITGYLRSNPRGFSLVKWIEETFPNGLNKPVFLYGCSLKQALDIPNLDIEVSGIISSGFITDAIYRMNPHWRRETRITKAFENWKTKIENINWENEKQDEVYGAII